MPLAAEQPEWLAKRQRGRPPAGNMDNPFGEFRDDNPFLSPVRPSAQQQPNSPAHLRNAPPPSSPGAKRGPATAQQVTNRGIWAAPIYRRADGRAPRPTAARTCKR